jgi:hypothetical protein
MWAYSEELSCLKSVVENNMDLQRLKQLAGTRPLYESVQAVPGIGKKDTDIEEEISVDDIDAAQNDIDLDQGSQFTEQAQVVSCNQRNPSSVVDACAMDTSTVVNEELGPDSPVFAQTLSRIQHLDNGIMDIEQAFLIIDKELASQGYDELERERICSWVEREINHDSDFDPSAYDIMNPDGEELEMSEAYDLQNGYKDKKVADGGDYFPTGADGPVTDKVGPSGARQGDNPEQKKMEVAETHKELVYSYKKFLKESASKK